MILPGILASGISGHLGGNYTSIATQTIGAGGSSSITFSSIPQTYTHLQIRALNVTSSASNSGNIYFNGDTTNSNYRNHYIYGNGTAANAASYNVPYYPEFTGGGATTSPGASILDILDYTNTNKTKVMRELVGYDANGSGVVGLSSNMWNNTSAITSINITASGFTFQQYTQFALYGVK